MKDLCSFFVEYDYALEENASGVPHLHILALTRSALRKDNMKRKVNNAVLKYVRAPDLKSGLDVRVVNSVGPVREYIGKQTVVEVARWSWLGGGR